MTITQAVQNKWIAVGFGLGIPLVMIEKFNDKYHDNTLKALIRVYRYWLREKNGLKPTWKTLCDALQLMNEIDLSIQIKNTFEVCFICL